MNITQNGIITLLKSAVTGESFPIPEGFSLEEAYQIIKKQGLVTLAYEGAVRCGIARTEPVMQEMFRDYYGVLLRSERQMAKVNTLLQEFDKAGIDHLPFKGCIMKQLYPKPELRVMGDADILIRLDQYEKIKPILLSLGFEMKQESDCEMTWISGDLYLELHICMIQPSQRDVYGYFGDGWGRAIHLQNYRYGFSAEDMYVYLFTHFVKHYRCGGIGCRHVVDLWMFRQANPDMDTRYVHRELEKLHLAQFHENCIRLQDAWFGEGQSDEVTEFIAKRIFSGGSWGNAKDYHIFVELSKMTKPAKIKNSRFRYAIHIMFPPRWQMRNLYPVLDRCPLLLPIMWVARGMKVLLFKREKFGAVINTGRIIDDDAMNAHQEALRMVGLEWRGQEYRED